MDFVSATVFLFVVLAAYLDARRSNRRIEALEADLAERDAENDGLRAVLAQAEAEARQVNEALDRAVEEARALNANPYRRPGRAPDGAPGDGGWLRHLHVCQAANGWVAFEEASPTHSGSTPFRALAQVLGSVDAGRLYVDPHADEVISLRYAEDEFSATAEDPHSGAMRTGHGVTVLEAIASLLEAARERTSIDQLNPGQVVTVQDALGIDTLVEFRRALNRRGLSCRPGTEVRTWVVVSRCGVTEGVGSTVRCEFWFGHAEAGEDDHRSGDRIWRHVAGMQVGITAPPSTPEEEEALRASIRDDVRRVMAMSPGRAEAEARMAFHRAIRFFPPAGRAPAPSPDAQDLAGPGHHDDEPAGPEQDAADLTGDPAVGGEGVHQQADDGEEQRDDGDDHGRTSVPGGGAQPVGMQAPAADYRALNRALVSGSLSAGTHGLPVADEPPPRAAFARPALPHRLVDACPGCGTPEGSVHRQDCPRLAAAMEAARATGRALRTAGDAVRTTRILVDGLAQGRVVTDEFIENTAGLGTVAALRELLAERGLGLREIPDQGSWEVTGPADGAP